MQYFKVELSYRNKGASDAPYRMHSMVSRIHFTSHRIAFHTLHYICYTTAKYPFNGFVEFRQFYMRFSPTSRTLRIPVRNIANYAT